MKRNLTLYRYTSLIKYLLPQMLILAILFSLGCSKPVPPSNLILGIDVSSSAQTELPKYKQKLAEYLTNTAAKEINIFVFADKAYEVYNGPKPAKDREVAQLIDIALAQAKTVKWTQGTNFVEMLKYVKVRTGSLQEPNFASAVIYTDGYFEAKKYDENEILLLTKSLSGIHSFTFVGVRIENKEKLYRWNNSNHIEVIFPLD